MVVRRRVRLLRPAGQRLVLVPRGTLGQILRQALGQTLVSSPGLEIGQTGQQQFDVVCLVLSG